MSVHHECFCVPYNFGTEVIQQIPVSDRTEGIKELDFSREPVPMERALGVQWCIESDTFNFTLSLRSIGNSASIHQLRS